MFKHSFVLTILVIFYCVLAPPEQAIAEEEVAGVILDTDRLAPLYHVDRALWVDGWGRERRIRQILRVLKNAESEGLHSRDYYVDKIENLLFTYQKYDLNTDRLISHSLLHYMNDMIYGRIKPKSPNTTALREEALRTHLKAMANQRKPSSYLMKLSPSTPEYQALKKALGHYRYIARNGGFTPLPEHITLQPGDHGKQVLDLQKRLKEEGYLQRDRYQASYNDVITNAVRDFQASRGLKITGEIDKATRKMLNQDVLHTINAIRINMERIRSWPLAQGKKYVRVNMTDFSLQAFKNGQTVLEMKTIIGKTSRSTPEFSTHVTHVIFNPFWNVPNSLFQHKYQKKLADKPESLREQGFDIFAKNEEGKWIQADFTNITKDQPYRLRQRPGRGNALGKVKFTLYNTDGIYMHDTSSPKLFNKKTRAFSWGCIRLEKPLEFAYYVLDDNQEYSKKELADIYNQTKGKISLRITPKTPVNVYVHYLTAWVDKSGKLQIRRDIYKKNGIILSYLEL